MNENTGKSFWFLQTWWRAWAPGSLPINQPWGNYASEETTKCRSWTTATPPQSSLGRLRHVSCGVMYMGGGGCGLRWSNAGGSPGRQLLETWLTFPSCHLHTITYSMPAPGMWRTSPNIWEVISGQLISLGRGGGNRVAGKGAELLEVNAWTSPQKGWKSASNHCDLWCN